MTIRHPHFGFRCASFRSDGKFLVSGNHDGSVQVWDPRDGTELFAFRGHSTAVGRVAVSPDHRWIASGSNDATVKIWDASGPPECRIWQGATDSTRLLAASSKGTMLACLESVAIEGRDRVTLRNVKTGEILHNLPANHQYALALALSPDEEFLATAGLDQGIHLWSAPRFDAERILSGHTGKVAALAFHPRRAELASAGADGTIRIWDSAVRNGYARTGNRAGQRRRDCLQSGRYTPGLERPRRVDRVVEHCIMGQNAESCRPSRPGAWPGIPSRSSVTGVDGE